MRKNLSNILVTFDKILQEPDSFTIDKICNDLSDRQFQMLMKAYETAVETRKFEIELFWKRSFFYRGIVTHN